MHQYYVKVVPTIYSYLDGSTREVWQYSVTEHVRHVTPGSGRGLPGVFFFYEVSPLVAEFEERRQGWRALLTGLAAIVGGVHATAALTAVLQHHQSAVLHSLLDGREAAVRPRALDVGLLSWGRAPLGHPPQKRSTTMYTRRLDIMFRSRGWPPRPPRACCSITARTASP